MRAASPARELYYAKWPEWCYGVLTANSMTRWIIPSFKIQGPFWWACPSWNLYPAHVRCLFPRRCRFRARFPFSFAFSWATPGPKNRRYWFRIIPSCLPALSGRLSSPDGAPQSPWFPRIWWIRDWASSSVIFWSWSSACPYPPRWSTISGSVRLCCFWHCGWWQRGRIFLTLCRSPPTSIKL